jgi:hypothetical protein
MQAIVVNSSAPVAVEYSRAEVDHRNGLIEVRFGWEGASHVRVTLMAADVGVPDLGSVFVDHVAA